MEKDILKHPALKSWTILNSFLRGANEDLCWKLLKEEKAGKARRQFIKRIHCRLNKARADRERKELGI